MMKRRTFLAAVGGLVAAAVLPANSQAELGPSMFEPVMGTIRGIVDRGVSRPGMKHLYDNGEGELVAANSLEEAAHHLDVELGGLSKEEVADRRADWFQVPDERIVPIGVEEEDGRINSERKLAREWAAEFLAPEQVATTYW